MSILLGNLLVAPFYSPPADAISNAVAAIVALAAVNIWTSASAIPFDKFLWLSIIVFNALVLFTSILSIALKDSSSVTAKRLSKFFSVFSSNLGTPKMVFSAVYLFALVTFHRSDATEYLVIGMAWALIIVLQPLELFANLIRRWREIFIGRADPINVGEVVVHQLPGIILVRELPDTNINFGDAIIARGDNGDPSISMVLDQVAFSERCWIRAVHVDTKPTIRLHLEKLLKRHAVSDDYAIALDPSDGIFSDVKPTLDDWSRRLIGVVAPNTDPSILRIEVTRDDLDLCEGRLVSTRIDGKDVIFQVITGLTKEEIIHQKNTNGYIVAEAKKVGYWDVEKGSFEPVKWIPAPNSPVLLVDDTSKADPTDSVGFCPGTDFRVRIERPDQLVTHNTAILGILGVGKTFLALELVERLIADGVKIICLDLTDQYAQELSPYFDADAMRRSTEMLQQVGPPGKNNHQRNKEEGGSVNQFKEQVHAHLRRFLAPDCEHKFISYNPASFEVWQQTGGLFDGRGAMSSLTPAEVTRIFSEATLEILQDQGMSDNARCCIIYEEAHSLIPEWNSVSSEGDKAAANGTARAILQGRKFGLGCLVITQRTANVTKSILNQCNSVFALRVFDATGMEFLSNYIGTDFSRVLSTLEDRHAVFFGRASSCKEPVLIRLNDREDFLAAFRDQTVDDKVNGQDISTTDSVNANE